MPLYDFQCDCGVFEEFRPYRNVRDLRFCKVCDKPVVLVYLTPPGIQMKDSYRVKMSKIGARPLEAGDFKHADSLKKERKAKQSKHNHYLASDAIRSLDFTTPFD